MPLIRHRLPILIASVCIGIGCEQFGVGMARTVFLVALMQLALVAFSAIGQRQ